MYYILPLIKNKIKNNHPNFKKWPTNVCTENQLLNVKYMVNNLQHTQNGGVLIPKAWLIKIILCQWYYRITIK